MTSSGKDEKKETNDQITTHHHHHYVTGIMPKILFFIHDKIYGGSLIGVFGYCIEWILELSHVSTRLHNIFHHNRYINVNKMGLLAITMIIIGHYTEHLHQVDENVKQDIEMAQNKKEDDMRTNRIVALEKRLSILESK